MNSIELFSGAGGLAIGLAKAGFHHKGLIERDANACATLRKNKDLGAPWLTDAQIIDGDVCSVAYNECFSEISLVAGGPPCQPFSMGGKAKAYDDSRDMFPEAIRAVRELAPSAFIFENVRGLLRPAFADYVQFVKLQLEFPTFPISRNIEWTSNLRRLERHKTQSGDKGLRYRVFQHLADAADYCVPQRRHRVFFVGIRTDLNAGWSFPMPTHSEESLIRDKWVTGDYWERHQVSRGQRESIPPRLSRRIEVLKSVGLFETPTAWQTVRDAFVGLPRPSSKHGMADHKQQTGARTYPGHTGSPMDQPAKALKAGDHGVPGGENMLRNQNKSVRYFTIRESARIQTFPDDYRLLGSWTEAMRQLGNAVPVDLAYCVGSSVMASIRPDAIQSPR